MRSHRLYLGTAAALAMLFLGAAQALAQAPLWLDPAYADHAVLGPRKAAGAVIWSHGRSIDSEDYEVETPPYIAVLGNSGWDTFRFNRQRAYDTLALSTRMLTAEVHRLKLEGYRQVVLAGQSFGAFLSLMAADASDEVDAVIATAPAAYGSFTDFYDSWRLNATKLYPLLEQLRHARVMIFYFHGDDFDPGGRGEHSREILLARKLPFIVVDQPPSFTSHWAAGEPQFAERFGRCILEFLETPALGSDARCDEGALVAGTADGAPTPRATMPPVSDRPVAALTGSR
jgi:pimeloyl-ACP methyl ester carboxylesterase